MNHETAQRETLTKGQQLLTHARAAEERRPYVRGRITTMFPYIYEASKKLSIRDISRWLEEEGCPISAPTISRALAKPEQYWKSFSKIIEPQAQVVKDVFKIRGNKFLLEEDTRGGGEPGYKSEIEKAFERRAASVGDATAANFEERLKIRGALDAQAFLEAHWFGLSVETRRLCMEFFPER